MVRYFDSRSGLQNAFLCSSILRRFIYFFITIVLKYIFLRNGEFQWRGMWRYFVVRFDVEFGRILVLVVRCIPLNRDGKLKHFGVLACSAYRLSLLPYFSLSLSLALSVPLSLILSFEVCISRNSHGTRTSWAWHEKLVSQVLAKTRASGFLYSSSTSSLSSIPHGYL